MYTQSEYIYGWLFYLMGVAVLMACWWWSTAFIRNKEVRHLLRLFAGVTLVVPWYASADMEYLAPAWLIAAFEGIFEGGSAFWRAGGPLLAALAVAFTISIVIQLLLRFRSSAGSIEDPLSPQK